MKLKISGLTYEPKDYPFGDAVLSIRPLPLSMTNLVVLEDGVGIKGEDQRKAFLYCLVGWRNVADEKGKDLPCTDEVKRMVFDFGLGGISAFVIEKARVFREQKADQEKN